MGPIVQTTFGIFLRENLRHLSLCVFPVKQPIDASRLSIKKLAD